MPFQNVLTQRLKLAHPIIQAPLAGGGDTPELLPPSAKRERSAASARRT
jgi:hypothetical protein